MTNHIRLLNWMKHKDMKINIVLDYYYNLPFAESMAWLHKDVFACYCVSWLNWRALIVRERRMLPTEAH